MLADVADDSQQESLSTVTVPTEMAGDAQQESQPAVPTAVASNPREEGLPTALPAESPADPRQEGFSAVPTEIASDLEQGIIPTATMPTDVAGGPQQETQSINRGDGDDDDDARSRTSTEYYVDHEPWDKFKDKVARLCRTLWSKHPEEQIVIERMKGGAHNRIVGVCVTGPSQNGLQNSSADEALKPELPPGDYILRITRSDDLTIGHEMAMLRFLEGRVSLGLPTVVHSDGQDNPLGYAYVLQLRVPGKRLDTIWHTLNHTQRLLVTLDIARLCAELTNITNNSCGIPEVEQGPRTDGTLTTIGHPFPGDDEDKKTLIFPQPPLEYLCDRLDRWGEEYEEVGEPWVNAKEIVRHMQATNRTFEAVPGGMSYFLTHGDLYPRNIMVQTGENIAFVTCILDWDDAQFAPAVISLSPPAWLWMEGWWKGYGEEGCLTSEDLWRTAHEVPGNKESGEIKMLWDSVVGPQYLRHAYSPDAYVARRVWSSAHQPCGSDWCYDLLEGLYKDWKASQSGTGTDSQKD